MLKSQGWLDWESKRMKLGKSGGKKSERPWDEALHILHLENNIYFYSAIDFIQSNPQSLIKVDLEF